MSTLAIVMDGRGYTRDSGAQGERGYEGDYRFSLVGATTPLKPRAWDVMGHTGQRFLFYEMPEPGSVDDVADDVFEGSELREKINRAKSSVVGYNKALWKHHGGPRSVEWESEPDHEIQQALKYLARLVRYGRAPLEDGSPTKEAPFRILNRLYDIARGRALLYDRQHLVTEDVVMCAHIALSTMQEKRREILRPVLHPKTDDRLTRSQIEPWVSLSRKTILDRMEMLETLEIGEIVEASGRSTKVFTIDEYFVWPDHLPFPERE